MRIKGIIPVAILTLLWTLVSFAQTQKSDGALAVALDSLKAHYAPDRRVSIFDVTCVDQGGATVARGEVDNPKAKDDAMATIHKILGGQVLDSVKVLPDPRFGEKIYGIVAVSVGNVRSNPQNSAELATQTLMGTVVKLLKKRGGYCYIQMPDKYMGWLEESAMKITDKAGVEAWNAATKMIVTTYFTMVREQPTASSLPVRDAVSGVLMKRVRTSGRWVAVELPDGRSGYIEKSSVEEYGQWKKSRRLTADNIEKTAKMFLGVPYLWGGTSSKGMDCSGFTKTVYRLNGLELSRDADQQAAGGKEVKPGDDFESLQKGDLLFFGQNASSERPERITHVGIYLGKKEYIHNPGAWVKINSFDPSSPIYNEARRKSFVRARRYIGAVQVPEVAAKSK